MIHVGYFPFCVQEDWFPEEYRIEASLSNAMELFWLGKTVKIEAKYSYSGGLIRSSNSQTGGYVSEEFTHSVDISDSTTLSLPTLTGRVCLTDSEEVHTSFTGSISGETTGVDGYPGRYEFGFALFSPPGLLDPEWEGTAGLVYSSYETNCLVGISMYFRDFVSSGYFVEDGQYPYFYGTTSIQNKRYGDAELGFNEKLGDSDISIFGTSYTIKLMATGYSTVFDFGGVSEFPPETPPGGWDDTFNFEKLKMTIS